MARRAKPTRKDDELLTSAEVVDSAEAHRMRGKKPVLSFMGVTDPEKALAIAQAIQAIPVICKAPSKPIDIGEEDPYFSIHNILLAQGFPVVVSDKIKTLMYLKFGLLKIDERKLSETYLLEIDVSKCQDYFNKLYTSRSFSNSMYLEFAITAMDLAEKFVKTIGFEINNEMSHWPKLRYLLIKPKTGKTLLD